MSIECYDTTCPKHPKDEPFCNEQYCVNSYQYTTFAIEGGDIVTQCCDCGAHVINKSKSEVKHCKTCIPGDAERWRQHYSQPDPTTDEEDEQICKAMEGY